MAGGEANFGIGMEHTRCGEPVLHHTVEASPVGPAFPTAAEKYSPPESRHPVAKYIKALHIARHRVVVEVALNVSGGEDGAIMAGPDGARPPNLDGGEQGAVVVR